MAIAPFLRQFESVRTLGIRATIGDYTEEERQAMLRAPCIFYPTVRFAGILEAAGCRCFPCSASYHLHRSRALQLRLAGYLDLPTMAHRICYGARNKEEAVRRFGFPLAVAGPRRRDPILWVKDRKEWEEARGRWDPMIVLSPWEEKGRVEVYAVGGKVLEWRDPSSASRVPEATIDSVLEKSEAVCRSCRLDETVISWLLTDSGWIFHEFRPPPMRWRVGRRVLHRFQVVAEVFHLGGTSGTHPGRHEPGGP